MKPRGTKDRKAPDRFFKVDEVAEYLALAPRTVWRLIDQEELQVHRFGRAVRISETDLNAFIGRHR
jgi:excisionase family DNA binding protein